jgi:hypothetical protein
MDKCKERKSWVHRPPLDDRQVRGCSCVCFPRGMTVSSSSLFSLPVFLLRGSLDQNEKLDLTQEAT